MSLIRKIAIGPNYPDGAVHYQVGSLVLRKTHRVARIDIGSNQVNGEPEYQIYIENIPTNGEIVSQVLWKGFPVNMPHVYENNVDFE